MILIVFTWDIFKQYFSKESKNQVTINKQMKINLGSFISNCVVFHLIGWYLFGEFPEQVLQGSKKAFSEILKIHKQKLNATNLEPKLFLIIIEWIFVAFSNPEKNFMTTRKSISKNIWFDSVLPSFVDNCHM